MVSERDHKVEAGTASIQLDVGCWVIGKASSQHSPFDTWTAAMSAWGLALPLEFGRILQQIFIHYGIAFIQWYWIGSTSKRLLTIILRRMI